MRALLVVGALASLSVGAPYATRQTSGASVATLTPGTSAQFAGVITDETGTAGSVVFSNSPTLTTPTIATMTSGVDPTANNTAATAGVIKGPTHIAGGTADQSTTLTIRGPNSKGSGHSYIVVETAAPAGSGTAVNTPAEVARFVGTSTNLGANRGLEVSGIIDASGAIRTAANMVVLGTIYPRGPNGGNPILVNDQGASGNMRILGQDNVAEMFCVGEGSAIAGSTCYETYRSTNGSEATIDHKLVIVNNVTDTITAFAGGGQASATQLTTVINRVTVVATANDSVKLLAAEAGLEQTVINADAADSMNVFPASGDAINNGAADAAFAVAAGRTIYCRAVNATNWGCTTP